MRWLEKLNFALAVLLATAALVMASLWVMGAPRVDSNARAPISRRLPAPPFAQDAAAYTAVGEPLIQVELKPVEIQLPDLRRYLQYLGRNLRPDINPDAPLLQLTLRGNEDIYSTAPGEPVYLRYQKTERTGIYLFSDKNEPTSLWVTVTAVPGEREEAEVHVHMRDVQGNPITEPSKFAEFRLGIAKGGGGRGKWSLGDLRVDPSLLARQRARWYGQDRFMQVHGGDEFAFTRGKERVDFGEGESAYAVYLGIGDALIWKDDRWMSATPGPETRSYPLMQMLKINGKLMNLSLWDGEGENFVKLNLVLSRSPTTPSRVFSSLRFLGTKTRSQAIVQVGDERQVLSRNDWLLLTKDGWKVLKTVEDVEDYVYRRQVGDLFVFDEIARYEGKQVLKGHVFNTTRTEMQYVYLPLQTGEAIVPAIILNQDESESEAPQEKEEPASQTQENQSLEPENPSP
ncbi:MAG: hypothetical protein KDK78_11680, partial [Chlamydiia bacterium]|nr:hypothetical protein [Chlamydiia bacterium]